MTDAFIILLLMAVGTASGLSAGIAWYRPRGWRYARWVLAPVFAAFCLILLVIGIIYFFPMGDILSPAPLWQNPAFLVPFGVAAAFFSFLFWYGRRAQKEINKADVS